MDVRVQGQRLSPGVEHAQASGLDLQAAACDVDERPAGGSEQQVVEDVRRMQSEDIEHVGDGEDHVEVRHREKLAAASFEPSVASCRSASRTGAVAAGVPLNVLVTAAVALLPLPAKGGRTACADRTQGFALRSRGAVVAQEGLASGSYDRAEVRLGAHASLVRVLCGSVQNALEGTDDVTQR